MSRFLQSLVTRASVSGRRLAFPESEDPRVLEAVATLVTEGIARPVLIGRPASVSEGLERQGLSPSRIPEVLDPDSPERVGWARDALRERAVRKNWDEATLDTRARDPLTQASLMVRAGEVDGAVAGCVRTTSDVLRAALHGVGLAPGVSTVSSAFYMALPDREVDAGPAQGPVLTFTDAGVVPDPNAEQLAEIARSAARARRLVVGDEPRVAFLSYSTHGSAEGASVAKVQEAVARFRALEPDVEADGELQADAALIDSVRSVKAPASSLGGPANVLVFPNLDAGNIAYKLVQRLAGATALGPVLQGLGGAMNDLSRGADTQDIIHVSCITALMAASE